MAEWNPNSTATKGLEWPVLFSGAATVPGPYIPCMALRQTVSEATGTIRIATASRGASGGLYVVEAYDNETAVPANVTTLAAAPNEDVSGTGSTAWKEDDGTTTTIYDQIDEAVSDRTDYIFVQAPNTFNRYDGRFNTGGLSLTGKRILAVRLRCDMRALGVSYFNGGLNLSGVNHQAWFGITGYNGLLSYTWYYNPQTKLPWRIADVQALDTSDEFYLEAASSDSGTNGVRVYWVALEVVICDENRLAFGTLDDTAGAVTENAWNTVTLTTPTAGTWTKDGAGYHTYMIRRLNSSGSFSFPFHLSGDDTQANPGRSYWPTLDATYGYATAMGDQQLHLFPMIPRTTGPADSVDAMPYFDIDTASVYNTVNAEQEFSNAAAANYGILRFLVSTGGQATQPLTIQVKRRSDNVQLGATYSLTLAEAETFPAISAGWRIVQVQLSSAAGLAAATQYYIQFSSTTPITNPWSLVFGNTGNVGNTATFGGTTDRALVEGSELDQYDLYVTLSTIPTTPANFAATLGADTETESVCDVTSLPKTTLSWSATALGGSFLRYEFQRSIDGGTEWVTFRTEDTEATTSTTDYEAPIGVSTQYRMRVVRTDFAVSAWTTVSGSTTTTKTGAASCPLYLVSNYDPTFNLIVDHEPEVDYTFLDNEEAVELPVYGLDYNLAFRPLEDRGVQIAWRIAVAFNGNGDPNQGKAAFETLRQLCRAQLPYVMVLDTYGNATAASLRMPSGTQFMPGRVYNVDLIATQVVGDYVVAT